MSLKAVSVEDADRVERRSAHILDDPFPITAWLPALLYNSRPLFCLESPDLFLMTFVQVPCLVY